MELEEFTDITYEVESGLAWITINRPERYNAFRARTIDELIRAFKAAWVDSAVGFIALTGAGEKAFLQAATRSSAPRPATTGPARPACSKSRHSIA